MNETSATLPPALQETTPGEQGGAGGCRETLFYLAQLDACCLRNVLLQYHQLRHHLQPLPSNVARKFLTLYTEELRSLLQSHSDLHVDEFKGEGKAEWWIVVSR